MTTIESTLAALDSGETSARELALKALAAIRDPAGQGSVAFVHVDADAVLAQAEASDLRRRNGEAGALEGVPLSIKDLFDVEGEVTRAGSIAYAPPPATRDAVAIERLRKAGAVFVGRTNMSEFAYSGVGINPHYGTPLSPWQRNECRVSGGSTSGGAASVADGMATATIGSDTGGSLRIPAACCGLVGLKPTARHIPLDGVAPLSFTLDTLGPIGRSVECVARLYAVMAGYPSRGIAPRDPATIRAAVPKNYVLAGMDETVGTAFAAALDALRQAGVEIVETDMPSFDRIPDVTARGGITAAEAYAWHRPLLETRAERYDPRVRTRVLAGEQLTLADYQRAQRTRRSVITQAEHEMDGFTCVLMPTIPIVPPRLSEFADDAEFARLNLLMLRNPTVANIIDGCAINVPMHETGGVPCGLSIVCKGGEDNVLIDVAATTSRIVCPN